VCASALEQIRLNAAGFLRSADPEFLHQLRVGMRRMRAALRAFRRVIPRREAKVVARRIKRFSAPLGAARDWDVLCDGLGRETRLGVQAQVRRDAARRRARKAVRSARFAQALASAESLAASTIPDVPLRELAVRVLGKSHRQVMKTARDIRWDDAARRHELRIRMKRLRYCCDYFSPCYRDGGRYLATVRVLQDILGELNDVAVGRALLEDLPRVAPTQRARMKGREARLIRRLPRAWSAFAAGRPFWTAPR
jgi:CHAD domain-containing protein